MDNNGLVKSDKAQRTRDRLLKSSLKLMKEKGYQNTTVREICNDAKVSIGTFYSYFPAKEDLFLNIYMEGDRFFTDSVALNLSGSTIAEKIVDFFRYYTRLNLNTGLELMKILFQSDNKFFSRYRPMQKVLEDIVQGGLESGELKTEMTSREIVDFFFVLARGCC
ncbi:MAG: TetR/AcrR family transcriptional regulator, partial [Oscillospiraceae bacterium]|nr:TetR/AcrR family transcriptional regulator [Oscillospiraceae bacterium]